MPERWHWDAEGDPRHLDCKGDGEMFFFTDMDGLEYGMCHACQTMDFEFHPVLIDGSGGADVDS
jgi:hypothetical protein